MYFQFVDLVSGATVGEDTQVGAVVLGHQRLLNDEPSPGVELDARWQVVLHCKYIICPGCNGVHLGPLVELDGDQGVDGEAGQLHRHKLRGLQ